MQRVASSSSRQGGGLSMVSPTGRRGRSNMSASSRSGSESGDTSDEEGYGIREAEIATAYPQPQESEGPAQGSAAIPPRTQSEPWPTAEPSPHAPKKSLTRSDASFASRSSSYVPRPSFHPSESQPGAEPGVDAVRDAGQFSDLIADCDIDVVDYGVEHAEVKEFRGKDANRKFLAYLGDTELAVGKDSIRKPSAGWAKVRWINVKGMDWTVIQALSLVYGLHPLALEDVLHSRDCRSKVDYYKDQLFVQGLALILDKDRHRRNSNASDSRPEDPEDEKPSWIQGLLGRGDATAPPNDLESGLAGGNQPAQRMQRTLVMDMKMTGLSARGRKMKAAQATVDRLRGEQRVRVKERNIYMFMFRDGTLITFHESKDSVNDCAIKDRLLNPSTVLRGTADISVLLQSLLDLMVDHAIQVVDAFQDQILELEQETLLRPHMDSVKLLHLLSADITLHKRAVTPLKTMIYGMRRYDLDRCIAMAASAHGTRNPDVSQVTGFMSHQSKVYLADVLDHLEYVISSMEMFETVTENLISYSFNILSYEMNEIMRRLTLATVIFFPLTFLTGYFGMNFVHMASLTGSDTFFWKVAVPTTVGFFLFFSWRDVLKALKYVRVKSISRTVHKRYAKSGRRQKSSKEMA